MRNTALLRVDPDGLKPFASKYIWWKTAEEAISNPQRVIAQVMNIGDYADVQALEQQLGADTFKAVLAQAEAGQFNARSWVYWHYRLGLSEPDQVPSLPVRTFA
jgi:hypothetical protein